VSVKVRELGSLSEIVPVETAQTEKAEFVPFRMAQIPNVLKVGSVIQRSIEEYCKYMNQ